MMNRRGFLQSIIKAGVGAAILPSAVTYGRKWVKPSNSNLYLLSGTKTYRLSSSEALIMRSKAFDDFIRHTIFERSPYLYIPASYENS